MYFLRADIRDILVVRSVTSDTTAFRSVVKLEDFSLELCQLLLRTGDSFRGIAYAYLILLRDVAKEFPEFGVFRFLDEHFYPSGPIA